VKAIIKYQQDGVDTEIHFDNVYRVRQKGDRITLIDGNGYKLKCTNRELRNNQMEIVLLPDETDHGSLPLGAF
jgi:16S rRNA U1498 N3-methylase RsmE